MFINIAFLHSIYQLLEKSNIYYIYKYCFSPLHLPIIGEKQYL